MLNKTLCLMKIILLLLIFFTFNISLYCQIILDQNDLPAPGDVQLSYRVDSIQGLTLFPGDSGANVFWDFGMLNFWGGSPTSSLDSVRWIFPDSIQTFPLADIALKSNCYWVHDWITHVIKEICYRDYYIEDSTGLIYYASNYPYAYNLYNYRTTFPILQYGQTKIDSSRIVIQKSTDSVLVTNIIDTNIADSWGELNTLIDVYPVVRIHTTETVWDSLYVNGIGELINYTPDNYYYKWYTKGLGFPVMQINKGILEKRSDYQIARFAYMKRNDAGINNLFNDKNDFNIVPNPFNNEAKINIESINNEKNISMFIYDVTGRQILIIKNISSDNNTIKRNELPDGIYSYKIISDKYFYGSGKFVLN